jgi:hypothetical protein
MSNSLLQLDDFKVTTDPAGSVVALEYSHPGDGGAVALAGDDGKAKRLELLERVSKGERVTLQLTAITFAQGPGAYISKPVGFTHKGLRALAATAPGTPFQRDHSLMLEDCGGTCVGAKIEARGDKRYDLVETLELVKPWAVEGALDGTVRTFSIQWRARDWRTVLCSKCSTPLGKCDHYPGQELEARDGERVLVRALFDAPYMIERSAVQAPAVSVTQVKDWRALSLALSAQHEAVSTRPLKEKRMENLLKALGAPDEESALAAVAKMTAEAREANDRARKLEGELAAKRSEHAETEAKLADAQKRAEALEGEKEGIVLRTQAEALASVGKMTPAQVKYVDALLDEGKRADVRGLLSFAEQAEPGLAGRRQPSTQPAQRSAGLPLRDGKLDAVALLKMLPEGERPSARDMSPEIAPFYVRANADYIASKLGVSMDDITQALA